MTTGGVYPQNVPTDWGFDLNLRHVHEKQKYGVSVQFPIQRYVLGLTSPKVPNRDSEYPSGATSYQGLVSTNLTCTNPLFAASLPKVTAGGTAPSDQDLCNLTPGTRSPSLIFYAHIGGVPHQLLQVDPTKTDAASQAQKATLTDADWQLILGKDPENFDYTRHRPAHGRVVPAADERPGAQWRLPRGRPEPARGYRPDRRPRMRPPTRRWPSTRASSSTASTPASSSSRRRARLRSHRDHRRPDADRLVRLHRSRRREPGRSRTPSSRRSATTRRTPSRTTRRRTRRSVSSSSRTSSGRRATARTRASSRRSARSTRSDMSGNGTDPLYGYNPAMNAIISRLSKALSHQCLPQRLTIDTDDRTRCRAWSWERSLARQARRACRTSCSDPNFPAYEPADPRACSRSSSDDQHAAFERARRRRHRPVDVPHVRAETADAERALRHRHHRERLVLRREQLDRGRRCAQEILFSKTALTSGVTTTLQCLEASVSVVGSTGRPAAALVHRRLDGQRRRAATGRRLKRATARHLASSEAAPSGAASLLWAWQARKSDRQDAKDARAD